MKKNYAAMSTEELQKNIKTSSFITGLLIVVLILNIAMNLFVKGKNFWGIIIIPLCLSPIAILNISTILQMKKELKSRNL